MNDKLVPLEKVESDYYLGDRYGWFSDDENQDSESSDEEFRDQVARLAGVRSLCKKKRTTNKCMEEGKDGFESDMDTELDQQFVEHNSKNVYQSSASPWILNQCKVPKGDEMPEAECSSHMEVDKPNLSPSKSLKSGLKVSDGRLSSSLPKSVSIAEDPEVFTHTEREDMSDRGEEKSFSSFNDENNILRIAANKMANESMKNDDVEFYDPDEDSDNEKWVEEHRRKLNLVSPHSTCHEESSAKTSSANKLSDSDAVLSCPACMSLLTRYCQRHEKFREQYRAIFVENCKVINDQTLFMPQSNKKSKGDSRKYCKQNALIDDANMGEFSKEDIFHPVQCSICSTNVGVFDYDEVFHFFNVLTGYA